MSFFLFLLTICLGEIYLLYFLMQIETFTPYNIIGEIDYTNVAIVTFLFSHIAVNLFCILISITIFVVNLIRKKKNSNYIPNLKNNQKIIIYINVLTTVLMWVIWLLYI